MYLERFVTVQVHIKTDVHVSTSSMAQAEFYQNWGCNYNMLAFSFLLMAKHVLPNHRKCSTYGPGSPTYGQERVKLKNDDR